MICTGGLFARVSSFKQAAIVCENDSNCGGIFFELCNKNKPVLLCSTNITRWKTSAHGCIYQKITSKMFSLKEYDMHPMEL